MMYNSVVKALFWHSHRLNSLAFTGKKPCLQDPGAQLLRRQRQKMPDRVGVQRYQRADNDQQDLQRQRVIVEPFGECRSMLVGTISRLRYAG